MKWYLLITASLLISSISFADADSGQNSCCQRLVSCSVQSDYGGNSSCGPFYKVEQTIMDCNGHVLHKDTIAQQLCQSDADQIIMSSACN